MTRLVTGAFAGAVLGTAWGYPWSSLGMGIIGAVLGTIGGYEARTRLVRANGGRDLPIGVLEDVVAVVGGVAIAVLVSVYLSQRRCTSSVCAEVPMNPSRSNSSAVVTPIPSGPIEPRARSAKSSPVGSRCRCTAVSVFM